MDLLGVRAAGVLDRHGIYSQALLSADSPRWRPSTGTTASTR